MIIRSVGRETLLREALDSVALQTYPNIEVVVVNAKGLAHPELGACCGRFPLRLVSRDHPLARSAAANAGLDEAKGDYLIFLDDDDRFYPNHISSLVQFLQQHPEARVAYAGVQAIRDPMEAPLTPPIVFNHPYDPVRLRAGNYIPINAVLFAIDLLRSGCRFDEGLDLYEDWDFWLQLSKLTTFVHCDQISANYRVSGLSGVGLRPDPQRKREAHVQVLDKWRLRWSGSEIHDLFAFMGQTQAEAAARIAALEHQLGEAERERAQVAKLEHLLSEKEAEVADCNRKIELLESAQADRNRKIELLESAQSGLSWEVLCAFRRGKNRLLPPGTRHRALYDACLSRIKALKNAAGAT